MSHQFTFNNDPPLMSDSSSKLKKIKVVKAESSKVLKSKLTQSSDSKLSAKSSSSTTTIKETLSEIDNLFADIKTKKAEKLLNVKKLEEKEKLKKVKKIKPVAEEGSSSSYGVIKSSYETVITNPEAPLERIDKESGLPVYKAHLLKVGEGGGTELCPFDCNCCF